MPVRVQREVNLPSALQNSCRVQHHNEKACHLIVAMCLSELCYQCACSWGTRCQTVGSFRKNLPRLYKIRTVHVQHRNETAAAMCSSVSVVACCLPVRPSGKNLPCHYKICAMYSIIMKKQTNCHCHLQQSIRTKFALSLQSPSRHNENAVSARCCSVLLGVRPQ